MATSSYALPKGRMIAPVTNFAMAPTVYQKQLPHAIQKGLKGNLGPFYGAQQAEEWRQELKKKEDDRKNAFDVYDLEKHPELYSNEDRAMNKGRHKMQTEYERTVPGGYNELGPTDDKMRVYASALSGTIHQHSPRFLETLVETPAHRDNKFTKGGTNVLLLGFLDPKKKNPDLNTTDLGYNPLLHKYRAQPPKHTALQRRTTRERTGYVSVAGGKKAKSEFGDKPSAMKMHMENGYSNVPPEIYLEDENACLNNKLRNVPTKHGNGEEIKKLLEHDQHKFVDKQAEMDEYGKHAEKLMSSYEADRQRQKQTNLDRMKHQYTFLDPYTGSPRGINYGRKANPLDGYNPIMDRPNRLEEEYLLQQKEKEKMLVKIKDGWNRQMKAESTWNVITNCDKLTGKEHMTPHGAKQVSTNERKRIDASTKNAQALTKLIQHGHGPKHVDQNEYPKIGAESSEGKTRQQQFIPQKPKKKVELSSGQVIFGKFDQIQKPEVVTPRKPSIFDPMVDENLKIENRRAAPFTHKYYYKGQANPKKHIECDLSQKIGGKLGDEPKEFILQRPKGSMPLTLKVTPLRHRKTGELCQVKQPPRTNANENISAFGVVVPSTRVEYDRRWTYKPFGKFSAQANSSQWN
jgi:hypothetical protein